ncbi:acyl-CoA thioesterase [Segetibacter sp. 3557_3]|uniref:acyl-CoA thioesterase n=1 Tax=Segetibacter sp. 3557_3 TaxID=2547429 RepID=UPI0010590E1F|nr:thioesterase family protein [Segetibacter sp. 3557_3]TDH20048.1 acyl-CoA thioesterase [Segetibacter sp. 3557_3]
MQTFQKPIDIRWSDIDMNGHVRHSAFYDFGAFCRISYLAEHGLGQQQLLSYQIGPVLFREECVFKRELTFGDKVWINMTLLSSRRDSSRWTMQHEIWKNDDVLAAIITIDGAWIDVVKRKLTGLPAEAIDSFAQIPRAANFAWSD